MFLICKVLFIYLLIFGAIAAIIVMALNFLFGWSLLDRTGVMNYFWLFTFLLLLPVKATYNFVKTLKENGLGSVKHVDKTVRKFPSPDTQENVIKKISGVFRVQLNHKGEFFVDHPKVNWSPLKQEKSIQRCITVIYFLDDQLILETRLVGWLHFIGLSHIVCSLFFTQELSDKLGWELQDNYSDLPFISVNNEDIKNAFRMLN